MGRELVKAPDGSDVVVEYGNEIARNVLQSRALPPVRQAIVDLANTGITVRRALIEARDQINLSIAYYNERGRIIREDVIPVVALASAHQAGHDALRSMNLDDDIFNEAMDDLKRKRQRRRESF